MKTRTLTLVIALLLLITGSSAYAQSSFSLGGELISPVGASAKIDVNENSAITGAFGFFISESFNNATLELNYLFFPENDDINIQSGNLSPYIGGGLAFRFTENTDTQVALRVPVGLQYEIDDTPFEVYMDIGPYINLTTNVTFSLDSSLGFRYQF